jgi:hypothetical protein
MHVPCPAICERIPPGQPAQTRAFWGAFHAKVKAGLKTSARKEHAINKASVLAKTGNSLEAWYAILDGWGACEKPHKEIASYLSKTHGVSTWWNQMIAVQYERDHGMREINQKCTGEFSLSKSATLDLPVSKIYAAWEAPKSRAAWLSGDLLQVTTANPDKNIRGKWSNGTSAIEVRFYPKTKNKTQIVVDHGKLAGVKDVARWKKFWDAQMLQLKSHLEKA